MWIVYSVFNISIVKSPMLSGSNVIYGESKKINRYVSISNYKIYRFSDAAIDTYSRVCTAIERCPIYNIEQLASTSYMLHDTQAN